MQLEALIQMIIPWIKLGIKILEAVLKALTHVVRGGMVYA